ncbi:transcriptional regulator, AraC family-like protein [Ramlibacter tataouinensis TTB310]|uniref:Transcriptional regulator, AraC family-like protein n=1 Tax=Ramlibacter tataouinensis (strain ATCC BAA-407 / DSM 14655 / LMG 21543 / TTB310) TaxID=365046 RepID=F5Y0S7_RAMTT|nr:transcriptional regulator, AraC family-like protein [Ramlibacter tataouinensis TTB310]
MLAAHGLPEDLSDEEMLLPARQIGRLLEASAKSLRCPDFGLRLAQLQDIRILGPIAIAIENARTVKEALDVVSKYMFVHHDGMSISTVPHRDGPGRIELCYGFRAGPQAAARQAIDLVLGGGHRILGLLGGENYLLHEVHLPYAPIAPPASYQRSFGVPVLFRQNKAALVVSGALLNAPLPHANESLRGMATDYLQKHFGAGRDGLIARVRLAIVSGLENSDASLAKVASLLALQPRTLQRRLADAGESFEAMRDDAMREAAWTYLRSSDMALSDIAARLGLSQQSALARSCKRWFGDTPLAVRRGALQAESPALSGSRARG